MPDVGMTPQVGGRCGMMIVGLDATPAGSVDTAVADFTGGAQTDFTGYVSNIAPITVVHSQTLGSTFKVNMPGMWDVRWEIPVATAAAVLAALNIDGTAAEFVVATAGLATSTRNFARARSLSTTADAHLLLCQKTIRITKALAADPLLGIIRGILTNNAGGAAPAATLAPLAEARLIFDYVCPVSPE